MTEHCLRALRLLQYATSQCFRYEDELLLVLNPRRDAEPFVKREKISMDAQDLDQFSVDALQEVNLRTNLAQLPKQNAIATDHHQNQESKAECQVATNVESMQHRASDRLPQPSSQSSRG